MGKRINMTGIINSILGAILLISCTVSQPSTNSEETTTTYSDPIEESQPIEKEKKYNVQISIMKHVPYCGGAAPEPSQLNNYTNYTTPLIAISKDGTKTDLWLNGAKHYAYLPEGDYVIKEKFKDVPLDEFIKNNSREENGYYTNGSEECFKNWQNKNLFAFSILNTDSIVDLSSSIGSSCFTGSNPCIHYTGPYPP